MRNSFGDQFDQHGTWRRDFALRLKLLAEWMKDHELMDAAVEERLHQIEGRMRTDKVMVAFVGEFSRGKSELINAIFFAGYKRRIMPASAGRTTMCPTELGYDADVPPCLRLLPIETRLQPKALTEWRAVPEKWTRIDLDVNNPAELAQALEKVAEVRIVSREEARALGFWHDMTPEDNPPVDAYGLVEVPRWRHALVNMAHPLLKQGLVILDTPGLNAIGAEPELTVSLIPQAQAVVFILAADTGVTKSDMAIWREHLVTDSDHADARLVVLNKIDTLWDELSTPARVREQIERQCAATAELLGISPEQVFPVSAQKGLLAKVTDDAALLRESRLPALEAALGVGLLGRRQGILRSEMSAGIADLRAQAGRVMQIRRRDLAEQALELKGLRGKNAAVINHMRARVHQEQIEFDVSGAKIHAIRSVHLRLLRELFTILGASTLKAELGDLNRALRQRGIKLGVKKAYNQTFQRLREGLGRAQATGIEIQTMFVAIFRQLNAEHGFSLQPPKEPDLLRFERDLELVERSHLQYLGVSNALKLATPEFADRLVRALATRLRAVYESALSEVELWNKSAAAQLDVQLRERRRNFGHRLEAIERIQQAATGLDERIADIVQQEAALNQLDARLLVLTERLLDVPQSDEPVVFAALKTA
ncbi:dynamin family protein [Polaromonas sp. C04]|uniref:dynamin family protein n=1 Tax=Polaromonas sp. C04 TaxID=1945857 RepID=UPI0009CA488D|nr:dynamin family protein [Polaromonas sp. C04]OOG58841.1 dynamin family protein [Polaromonas sp. C04]